MDEKNTIIAVLAGISVMVIAVILTIFSVYCIAIKGFGLQIQSYGWLIAGYAVIFGWGVLANAIKYLIK